MSKTARQMAARGLTASDRGKQITYSDERGVFRTLTVEEVRYSPLDGTTQVRYTDWAAIPNMAVVTVSS